MAGSYVDRVRRKRKIVSKEEFYGTDQPYETGIQNYER